MFELCPKCDGRRTIGEACTYCGAKDAAKKAAKKPAKKKASRKD